MVILRLDRDVFAGYADLVPGTSGSRSATESVRRRHRRSGELGKSNGPHLHFQLMNEPSLLASTGLPLEFREFRLDGVIPSMDAFGEAFATENRCRS